MDRTLEEFIQEVKTNYDTIWEKAFAVGFRMGRDQKCLTCPYREVGESENADS